MFCSNCGSKIDDEARFCSNCGHPVKMQAESAVEQTQQETAIDTTPEVVETQETAVPEESPAVGTAEAASEVVDTESFAGYNESAGIPENDSVSEYEEKASAPIQETAETSVAGNSELGSDAAVGESAVSGATAAAGVFSAGTEADGSSTAASSDSSVTAQYAQRIEEKRAAQSGAQNGQFNQTENNMNGSFNAAPNTNVPQPKSTISTVGQVLCIVALVLMFFQCFRVIGSAFGIFGCIADEGFLGLLYGVINFGINILKMCGLVISALVMYLVWKKWDDNKVEPLMVGTVAGGALILITIVLRLIFSSFFNFVFGYHYANLWSGAFLSIVFSVAMMVITYTLVSEKQLDAFSGLKNGNFADGIKKDFKDVSEMAVQAKNEYQAGRVKTRYQAAGTAQNGMNQAQGAGAAQTDAYGRTTQPYNGNAYVPTHLDTDRSIVAYILLGLITCSIYSLYMLHCIIKDVNVTCRGDGKETKGILEYIVFGILTCGIYDYIWLYKFGNRIQENAPRYGMQFQEGGTTILLWFVFGSLLCGIGPWVGMYYIIRNTNALNAAYNNMMAQQANNQQNQ